MATTTGISPHSIRRVLDSFPRRILADLPTPLQRLDTLSSRLGINLFVKRDDLTGLALGGNKVRKLEFVIADALAQGADSIVTWAGVQSNWCRQTAAAARKYGIKPVLVLFSRPGLPDAMEGNALLDSIYGAEIHMVPLGDRKMMSLEGVRDVIDPIVKAEEKAGRECYIAPIGASLAEGSMTRPLGALGYVNAVLELKEQAEAQKIDVDAVVFATGSGSMHAGLVAGGKMLCPGVKMVGISVSNTRETVTNWVKTIADQTLNEFGDGLADGEVIVFDEYVRAGYGILDKETIETLQMVAMSEGLLLDPVYTGKAFAALLDLLRRGYFKPGENVVFLHTGGAPGTFAYGPGILEYLQ